MLLYTIGHSNHSVEKLVQLLSGQGIACLVDVRSRPYSRFSPQFNKKALQQSLADGGVEYIYLGDSLGGRPNDPTVYIHGTLPVKSSDFYQEIDYRLVMEKPWFIDGIHRLLELAGQQPTCILCSEKDPTQCHRQHLIARYLLASHPEVTVLHILADGSLLDAAAIARIDDQAGQGQLPLKI